MTDKFGTPIQRGDLIFHVRSKSFCVEPGIYVKDGKTGLPNILHVSNTMLEYLKEGTTYCKALHSSYIVKGLESQLDQKTLDIYLQMKTELLK